MLLLLLLLLLLLSLKLMATAPCTSRFGTHTLRSEIALLLLLPPLPSAA
jgi:hypothetical protein